MNNILQKSQLWAISGEGMQRIMAAVVPESRMPDKGTVKDFRQALSGYFNQREDMVANDGIAEIHVKGAMLSDATPFDLALGMTSYDEIREDLQLALADEDVNAVVMVIDTPGGTVSGIEETYDLIKNASKPVHAYVEGFATSAGYYLASACDSICSTASATIGNIGTILTAWDLSEFYEKMGAKKVVFTNEGATLKGTFSEPLTAEQSEFIQERIDEMGAMFRRRVEENRSVSEDVFRAGWYSPDRAGELGLIDSIGTLSDFRASIAENA